MNRAILIHGPLSDTLSYDRGRTRIHERRNGGRPRRQQILRGAARIGGDAGQRDDIAPVFTARDRRT